MCYCLIRVDVVKWFCAGFLLNGNISVLSMRSGFVSIGDSI